MRRGFANPSKTTCYFGAALHCLLHSPQLVNYLLADNCATVDVSPRKRNAAALAKDVIALARRMWTEPDDGTPLDLQDVQASLGKHSKMFAKKDVYHDAHECLLALIDGLHQGLNKFSRPIPGSLARKALAMADPEHLAAWDAASPMGTYSFLTEIFQGQRRRASDGQYEHFWGVSLDVSMGESLVQLVAADLGDDTITFAPLLLVVHLHRTADKFVHYGADLEVYGEKYVLYAVCMYHDAHYMVMCENHGHWTRFDDEMVAPVTDPDAIIQRDATMLLYKR